MRNDQFEEQMTRVWQEHRQALRSQFRSIDPRAVVVHQRFMDMQHAIATASGEKIDYRWGPAEYNLEDLTVSVPYRMSCEAIDEDVAFTIEYRRDGTHFGNRRYALEDMDGLLAALNLIIWENFSPPAFRKQPIYAPPAEM